LGAFHSTRKARLQIEAGIKTNAQSIEDSYDNYQVDSAGAHQQLEDLRNQGIDALKKAGVKDISRSRVGHVDHWVDLAEKDIAATEAERKKRGAIVFGPAQFHTGGLVRPELAFLSPGIAGARAFHSGGEVNANLLTGEGVVNRWGMSRIGEGGLKRINAGGGLGGDTHFHINAMDAKSFEAWLDADGGKALARHNRRVEFEGRG